MEFKRWYLVPFFFVCWCQFYYFNLHSEFENKIIGTVKFTSSDGKPHLGHDRRKERTANITTENVNFLDLQEINNKNRNLITLRDKAGNVILNRSTNKLSEPLGKWKPRQEVLAFIHIGKAGGTSFETALKESILEENQCRMKCARNLEQLKINQPNCPKIKPMLCHDHFDWTAIDAAKKDGHKMAPVTLFRHPIERVVSHFYYGRSIEWTRGKKIRRQNLTEYLNDVDSMMDSYSIWHDGQGGACWLAGTHAEGWVWSSARISKAERERRQQLSTNWTYMLNTALDNLHNCLWFGLMDKLDESLELFEYQTGLKIHMKHLNKHLTRKKYPEPTEENISKLKKLMPMDLFLYEYAKQLFERRWQMYLNAKNGESSPLPTGDITLSKLPKIMDGCKSTSHYLKCPDDTWNWFERTTDKVVTSDV